MTQSTVFQINDLQIKSCLVREKDLLFSAGEKKHVDDFSISDASTERFIRVSFRTITEMSYPQESKELSLEYETKFGEPSMLELNFETHQKLIEFVNKIDQLSPFRKEIQDDPVAQKIMLPSMLLGLFVYIGFAMVVILKDLKVGKRETSFDSTPVGFLQKYLTLTVENIGEIGTYALAAAMVLGGVYLFVKTITQKSKVFVYERTNLSPS